MTDGAPRPFTVDGVDERESELNHVWSECFGAGRANEALRADWQAHLADARETLGVRYVRFHGLFHDDMFVYRATDGGGFAPPNMLDEPVLTFSYIDKVFDALLRIGVKPFVELGFMPRELATETETLFWWKAHCSPPTDVREWVRLVTATVEHWIDRYGIEEVLTWPFEVWNEPNLVPKFWTGTRSEYFALYEATARAVKAIDPRLRVGGPSTSVFVPDARYDSEYHDRSLEADTAQADDVDALPWKPVWIREFIEFCHERGLPIDFLSTHLYPTDYAADSTGSTRPITRYADATADDLRDMRRIIADSPYPHAELHITEWSTSPSSRDAMHDTVFAATYIVRAFLNGQGYADSIAYWTFTDIFEEGGAGIGPFHGGFGLINEQGIRKPTFHALAALARLGDRLVAHLPHGAITRSSQTGAASAVFFNYPRDMADRGLEQATSFAAARELAEVGPELPVRHTIRGLTGSAAYELTILDLAHGNVAEEWHRMGSPLNLTPTQERALHEAADDLSRSTIAVGADGTLEIDLVLAPWAVASIAPASA